MDDLFKLALSSQTIFGGIQFLLFSISLGAVIGALQHYHANDGLTFNCSPKPSDFTKQLCYDKYASTLSPLLIPRNVAAITYAVVFACWICFMLYGAVTLRQIKREQAEQNRRRHQADQWRKLLCVYFVHVGFRLVFLGVMIGLFCSYQTLDLPSVFKCSPPVPQTNTTTIPVNQTETGLQCNDLHYKEKSNLNIAIIVIECSFLMLGILEVIHLSLPSQLPRDETFQEKLLGNVFNVENMPERTTATENTPGNIEDEPQQMEILVGPNEPLSRDEEDDSSQDAKERKHMTSDLAETFNLKECQKQLKDFYNTRDKVKVVPLNQSSAVHIKDIYTNLSWVRDDRKPSGVTEKKLEDYTEILHGDEHHPNPNRILVSGGPGIGKTIFSKKIALDWSQRQMKEILSKFDLVLRIALRDVCNLHDIHNVLKASKLLAADSEISIKSLYDYIHQNQEKVLLILDGYDEYSCAGESPIRDIWEGALLRNCHVILTTRHGQADEVKGHSQVQFKINGFNSEDQVKTFASNFLEGEEDVQEFVKYLKQKHLMGIAEIPLLLLMLCSIWQEKRTVLPTSHANIYTHFILTLLDHKIEKDADSKQLKDLNDYNEELCKLGKLAFDELLRDSLVIRCSELPDKNLVQKLGEVGLCQILNLPGLNRGKGVYFIHKSIQEFLAAWYLKEELLPSRKDENTTCLPKTKKKIYLKKKVDSFEKTVKMIEVFKFACEQSAEAACTVLSHLGMIGKKEGLTEYTFTETPSDRDLSKDQRQLLTLISHSFFHCTPEKKQDLYTVFLSYVGGVLLIDSDQLHRVANEHLLKSVEAPNQ